MADYTIDGFPLKATYGLTVIRGSGFLDPLARKGTTSYDWPDVTGVEAYTEAADLVYEARTITLQCVLQGTSTSDFLAKWNAFQSTLDAPGLRELYNPYTGTTHEVCRVDGSAVSLLTKWNESENYMSFTLKLLEPSPETSWSAHGALSDYAENSILDHILGNTAYSQPGTLYVALCKADPTDAGTGSTLEEPTGGAYARQPATFSVASLRASANSTSIIFPTATATWGTLTHFAVTDHLTTGNIIVHGALERFRVVGTGGVPKFGAGDLDVSVDSGAVVTTCANSILDTLLNNTPMTPPSNLYLALTTARVVDADTGSTIDEPAAGGYFRTWCSSWRAASSGASTRNGLILSQLATGTMGTLTHFALCDALTTGAALFHGSIVVARVVTEGGYVYIPDGALALSID